MQMVPGDEGRNVIRREGQVLFRAGDAILSGLEYAHTRRGSMMQHCGRGKKKKSYLVVILWPLGENTRAFAEDQVFLVNI